MVCGFINLPAVVVGVGYWLVRSRVCVGRAVVVCRCVVLVSVSCLASVGLFVCVWGCVVVV